MQVFVFYCPWCHSRIESAEDMGFCRFCEEPWQIRGSKRIIVQKLTYPKTNRAGGRSTPQTLHTDEEMP